MECFEEGKLFRERWIQVCMLMCHELELSVDSHLIWDMQTVSTRLSLPFQNMLVLEG